MDGMVFKKVTGSKNHFPVEFDKKVGTKSYQELGLSTNLQKFPTHFDFFTSMSGLEDAEG